MWCQSGPSPQGTGWREKERAGATSAPGANWHAHLTTCGATASTASATGETRLQPSPLEGREKLEQLRALEAGMRIAVAKVEHGPFGVDTPADLERARAMLAGTR